MNQQLLFFWQTVISSPLFCLWWNYPTPLFGIWADDQELVRNLASLPAAPSVFSICSLFSYILTMFMMPWCSKFMIKWWLTCFWGIHYRYYSFFWSIAVFYLLAYLKSTFLVLLEQNVKWCRQEIVQLQALSTGQSLKSQNQSTLLRNSSTMS